MLLATNLLTKYENLKLESTSSEDSVTLRLNYSDIESIDDLKNPKELAKEVFREVQSFDKRADIVDVDAKMDGSKKQLVIVIVFKGQIDKNKFRSELTKLITKDPVFSKNEAVKVSSDAKKVLTSVLESVTSKSLVPFSVFDKVVFHLSKESDEFTIYDNNSKELESDLSFDDAIEYIVGFIPYLADLQLGGKLNKVISEKEFLDNIKLDKTHVSQSKKL